MSDTSWQATLPECVVSLWILRIAFMVFIFGSGFGSALWIQRDNFQHGAEWMQKAYTTPGGVLRVNSTDGRLK